MLNKLLDIHPEINPVWLLTGKAEMERGNALPPPPVTATDSQTACTPLDAEAEELLRLLKRYGNKALVEDVKKRLMNIKQATEVE